MIIINFLILARFLLVDTGILFMFASVAFAIFCFSRLSNGKMRHKAWLLISIALFAIAIYQSNNFFDLGIGVPRKFSAENWAKTEAVERHFMVDDLLQSTNIIGMTEEDALALLGTPDYIHTNDLLSYIIDQPFDESTLDFHLNQGIITTYEIISEH